MRIGIDARLWSWTGVGRYITNLVLGLSKIDKKNTYVVFVMQHDYAEVRKSIKNKNFEIRVADIHWHSLAEQVKFPQILNAEHLDLVHFTYFSVPIMYRRPYVMTMHDLIINQTSTGRASTLPGPIYHSKRVGYKMIVGNALKNAKKIIVPTKAIKQELTTLEKIDDAKVVVTYEGADFQNQRVQDSLHSSGKAKSQNSKELSKLNLENGKYFLYVGNAYPHKNLDRLTRAFHLLNKKYKDIKLVLVGKKDYFYTRLEKELREKKMSKNIVFTGFVEDRDLITLYRHASALVAPALMEGFGLPPVEAMARDCLIVASGIPVLKEVCAKAALYFDPEDENDMEKTLEKVVKMSHANRTKYIVEGRSQVKKFSWDTMVDQTRAVYESCLSIRSN